MKVMRSIPTAKIRSTKVAQAVSHERVTLYHIPVVFFLDNGQKSVKFSFILLRTYLGVEILRMTMFHQQTNGLVERYKETLVC